MLVAVAKALVELHEHGLMVRLRNANSSYWRPVAEAPVVRLADGQANYNTCGHSYSTVTCSRPLYHDGLHEGWSDPEGGWQW